MTDIILCPVCEAQCDPGVTVCWLCRQPMLEPAATPRPVARDKASVSSFSLTSLMLVMTLVAVCLGLFVVAPGLGVLLSIAAVPALARTAVLIKRGARSGQATTASDKMWLFAASMGGVIVAGVAASVAFFGACVAACFGVVAVVDRPPDWTIVVLLVVGGGAGAVAAWWVLRRLWKRR